MGRLSLTALIMWALCFGGANCGSAKVQGPQSRAVKTEEPSASVAARLTAEQPRSSLPVATDVLTSGAEVLEVTITKVVNPALTPITIYVFLTDTEKGTTEPRQIPVGNFSLYPPDQPGKFLLDAAAALGKVSLSGATAKGHDVRLVFEMKRIDETRPWTPVEVTIAEPKWRAAER